MPGETKVSICNSALALLGQSAIAAFEDDSDAARTCSQLYDNLKWSLLAQFDGSFSKKKVALSRLVTAPLTRWRYQYTMPTDRVGDVYAAFPSDQVGVEPTTEYDVQNGKLLTNYSAMWLDYHYNVLESTMPPYFVQLLIYVLAGNFAMPITEQATLAEHWHTVAYGSPSENLRGGYFRVAKNIDSAGRPPQQVDSDILLAVRPG